MNDGNVNGDPIEVKKGEVITKVYKVTLPAKIKNIDLLLGDLPVVAFISEGAALQSSILTGNSSKVLVLTGSGANATDIDLEAVNAHPSLNDLCEEKFTPAIRVNNNSDTAVTGVKVMYVFNGQKTSVDLAEQQIAAGGSFDYSFPEATISKGLNEVFYSVYSLTNAVDYKGVNNTSCSDIFMSVSKGSISLPYDEDFEKYTPKDK